MAGHGNTPPAAHVYCKSTEEHVAHNWRPKDAKWAPSVYWRCRGINREEGARGAAETERAIRKDRKQRF